MRRLKSVDIFRGMCILYMTMGHQVDWWIIASDYWIFEIVWNLGAPIGGGGFLIVSGISAAISYRSRLQKYQKTEAFSKKSIRNEYMFRALFILLISFIWNIIAILIGMVDQGIQGIWLWFVIQTISISLILAWPLLKVSRVLRVIIAFSLLVANEYIFMFLEPFQGQGHIFGVIFYILYNTPSQNVILAYFPYLLMGTVIGDLFFDIFSIDDSEKQTRMVKNKVYLPFILGGIGLTLFGFGLSFPDFYSKTTLSSHIFIFGIEFLLLAFLLWMKDIKQVKFKKSYRLFFFYSFYSFSIFLTHYLLYILFPRMLNGIIIWFFILPTTILWTLLWRFSYKKLGKKASIKGYISDFASSLAKRIETFGE